MPDAEGTPPPLGRTLRIVHAVIGRRLSALFRMGAEFLRREGMKRLLMLMIPIGLLTMSGCVVAPYGYYHRGYYGPRIAVVAPLPVVVVRP
jgi:hypothetical protein